ncbi:MAG: hypothetical protein M3174_00205, partial [Actinomycetota bacterium]|nr:hypothetical protein [Actinomycetota bacterium]
MFDLGSAESTQIGRGSSEALELGRGLYVYLLAAVPDDSPFPSDKLLGYDLVFHSDDGEQTLDDVGLEGGLRGLAYDDLPLPSFFVPSGNVDLRVLHGSCRLLHGRGPDALA